MSKNNPTAPNSSTSSNQKQDKSFSIWNLFNSKNKTCENTKHCDEENCESRQDSSTNNGISRDCCSRNRSESMKMSNTLKENLNDTNSIQKRINFIKEFNELIGKNHVCYSDFKLVIFKTIDVFGLKTSNEQLDDLENQAIKLDSNRYNELHQLRVNILKMYTKLIDQQFDLIQEEVRKILFVVLSNCIPFDKLECLDNRTNQRMRNELNECALEMISSLTNQGKNVCCFRFEIDIFCLNWFDDFNDSPSELTCKYLNLITNLIRFNASAFVETVCKFVEKTSHFFSIKHETGYENKEIHLCLELFDIIFRYSILPSEVLNPFLITLCIAVNYDNLKELAWKILRNLTNTDLSYTILNNLLNYINQDNLNITDKDQVLIVCGSIYFITNSLWNCDEIKVHKIKHQPSFILPTLSNLLYKENLTISTQIASAIKLLLKIQVNKLDQQHSSNGHDTINQTVKRKDLIVNSNDLDNNEYDLLLVHLDYVLNILEQLTDLCNKYVNLKETNQRLNAGANNSTVNGKLDHSKLIEELDAIVKIMEKLFLNIKQFNCDEKTFNFICVYTGLQMRILAFENQYPQFLIERMHIIIDKYEQIINSNCENWLQSLTKMIDQCFKYNLDASLRIRTLKCLQKRLKMNAEKDEELIIDKIVIPYLKDVEQEIDFKVRDQILRFLIGFLKDSTNNLLFIKVLEIIGRTLKKTLIRSRNNSDTSNDISIEEDPNVLIVRGLIEIFEMKIYEKNYTPSLEVFKLLSNYVCSHYCEGNNFEKISYSMRLKILNFMFRIKPNHDGYIGIQNSYSTNKDEPQSTIKYSKFLRCRIANQMPKSPSINSANHSMLTSSFGINNTSSSTIGNQFSYEEMFTYINLCLGKERDWNILSIVLEKLPFILSNSYIIYSTNYEQTIRMICDNCLTLSREISNLNQTNNYINMPKNVKSSDLQNYYIFSVLTSLIPYRGFINPEVQTLIVSEVRKGLCFKQSMQQCITCLTIFTTEFQDAISKDLPHILHQLSRTTASSQLAIPILEFLSILNLWPNLYSSFVSNEFLSIFAIIIPYTNPTKFDEYSVALAYRVATMWYLSSRYQYRKTITDFIIKQLPENIKFSHKQSKENVQIEEYRKRSSSLNTENDLNKKTQDSSNSTSAATGRLTGFNNNSLANVVNNSNLHNSPSLPSPVLAHQNSVVFNFNNQEKSNQVVPISPNTKQLHNHSNNASNSAQSSQVEILHTEYIESFVDLMSRNVVCGCSTLPNQDPIGKFLLENGQSETWLVGNKLITITTSSCNSKAVKGGDLCENCFNKLNAFEGKPTTANGKNLMTDDDVFNEPVPGLFNSNTASHLNPTAIDKITTKSKFLNDKDFLSSRRRHQSAFIPTASGSINRKVTSRDDSQIENNTHMYNSCRSWASGWAEILIRTATGNTSWILKLQNSFVSNFQSNEMNDLLLNYLIASGELTNATTPLSTTNQSTISLNQQQLNQNRLSQISEQPYLTTSNTNLSHQSALRGRSNTISTSSDMSLKRNELRQSNSLLRVNENDLKFKNKMHPSFVFLQFFNQGTFGPTKDVEPVLLPKEKPFENTLSVFDRITPSETYKVGIIYVDKSQSKDRQEILRNEYGSERYMQFVKRVGTLIRLDEIDSQKVFIGGLSQDGTDGDFACIYHENLTQIVFHVATFMPNKDNDPKCNDKMRHIGNNHVCIVYNDSQEEFDFSVIKGQWLKVCIIITPCAHEQNSIHVQTIPELENLIMFKKPFQVTISDQNMPHFVRQLSISTSLISLVYHCKGQSFSTSPFLSNWVNRIRKIKDIKEKIKNYTDMTSLMKHKNTNNSNEDVSSSIIGDMDSIGNSLESFGITNFTSYI